MENTQTFKEVEQKDLKKIARVLESLLKKDLENPEIKDFTEKAWINDIMIIMEWFVLPLIQENKKREKYFSYDDFPANRLNNKDNNTKMK